MAFKYNYPITDDEVRISTGSDAAPTRGFIWAGYPSGITGPTGTIPDYDAKGFHRLRVTLRNTNGSTAATGPTEEPAGYSVITVWYRDITERGDAYNRNPSAPDPAKVLWVKDRNYIGVTINHLEEFIINDVYMRGVYIQITALDGSSTDSRIYVAPYDQWQPFATVD